MKFAVFGAGIALGSFLIGVVSLPFFFPYNSVKAGVEIKPQAARPSAPAAGADPDDFIEGNYWALIIGINKYPTMDKDKQLEAARKDAEAVSKLLIERYGFSKERMVELYDEQASRKGIIRAFSSLKRRLTDKDSLFIYYAGHGEYESTGKEKSQKEKVDGMGYWIPSDAELDDPSSYIFNSQVRDYLANIPARHIYAVVDSCFSGSLMGRSRQLGRGAIKELYQSPSRWILASGGLYPVPDAADKAKQGHSTFAWHFMKLLRQNTNPYLLAKDLAEPMAIRVSNEVKDQLPRSAPVVAAGDEGGQFVFRLKREFQQGAGDVARIEGERSKLAAAAQGELSSLEEQVKKAEEDLKKQQEEIAKRKQAMLDRIKQAQEEAKRA
ncbi:MAG: caspase family protein, partial [Nitrospirota bacterium]